MLTSSSQVNYSYRPEERTPKYKHAFLPHNITRYNNLRFENLKNDTSRHREDLRHYTSRCKENSRHDTSRYKDNSRFDTSRHQDLRHQCSRHQDSRHRDFPQNNCDSRHGHHPPANCKFLYEVCSICGIQSHIAKVCRKSQRSNLKFMKRIKLK